MRKIVVFMLLLLMATGVAFADDTTEEQQIPPEGELTPMGEELTPMADDPIVQEDESVIDLMQDASTFNLEQGTIKFDRQVYYYEGEAVKPKIILTCNETTLVENEDYTLTYDKNNGVGIATVTATAVDDSRCTGTLTAEFEIKAPTDISKATIALSKGPYYKTGKGITPVQSVTVGTKKLTKGKDYTLKYSNNVNVGKATVTATAIKGSGYTGAAKTTFTILPKKPAAAAITKIKSSKPTVNVTWKKVACTGYELQVSLNSDFSKATKYKLKAVTKKVPKLKHNKKYYFRVRAYNTENKKTTYGAWSKDSAKVKTTGPVGNKYSKNGAYIKDKTIKYDGNYYYYNNAGLKSGCSEKMWDKVKNTSSKTKYLIAVDCTKNRTCIYKGKKGNWELKDYWKCTTGKKSTPTIKGKFKVCGKVSHFGEQKGYSVWYATRIKYEYYFHSILYKPWSKSSVLSGTLGKNKSHGCIRLKLKNAKWIYKNCKSGTRIVIY